MVKKKEHTVGWEASEISGGNCKKRQWLVTWSWVLCAMRPTTKSGVQNVVTLSHILALDAIGETFSDPKLAKHMPGCLFVPHLPPIKPIKKKIGENQLFWAPLI